MTDNERAVSLASDGLANVLALSWMNEHRAEVHAEKERDGGAKIVILRESFRRRMTEESGIMHLIQGYGRFPLPAWERVRVRVPQDGRVHVSAEC